MRYPQLDERLQAAADLFSACELGADIGADHGRLSCFLLYTQKCSQMLISDISADSLQKARDLMHLHSLDDRADFCVADGLASLEKANGKVGCAAICGMGGALVSRILQKGQASLKGADLVLSSHTDIPMVRKTIVEIGYHIAAERIVRAKGRFYIVMRCEAGETEYSEKELYLGPCLLREKPDMLLKYLMWREGVVAREIGHEKQLAWIREEIAHVKAGDCSHDL